MPTASIDDVLTGYRQLAPGERLKLWRPSVYLLDWNGSRFAWISLVRSADLADFMPTSGPSASDTREPCEMAVAVADPAARPSAPRPSPATPYADLGRGAVAA